MEYVNLGKAGLRVSRLCLGCMTYGTPKWWAWVLPEEESRPLIRRALESGINFFDTADIYSLGESERVLGRALKEFARRDQVVIATKVYGSMGSGPNDRGLSRKHIMDAIDASLHRLGTDYVDLYQIHRWDKETPIEETLAALHDLVKSGKARYVGASAMYAWQFAQSLYKADLHGWTRFVSMQNHYNLVYREEEREMIPLCQAEGIAIITYSPFARGFLSGNAASDKPGEIAQSTTDDLRLATDHVAHSMYYQDVDFAVVDRVTELAKQRRVSNLQIALAWVLQRPCITAPVIGPSKPHHLEEAIAALEIKLSSEECAFLEEPYVPHRVLGHT